MGEKNERLLELRLDKVRLDGGTQSRANLDSGVVSEYAQAIRDGADFPPVIVFHDGSHYWLASGFHRWHAHMQAKRKTLTAKVVNGTVRDAILFAVGTNGEHGKRRSSEDIRHAVRLLLTDPEWKKWSDSEIARRCKTNRSLVADEKKIMREEAEQERKRAEAKTAEATAAKSSPASSAGESMAANPPPPAAAPATTTYTTKHGTVSEMKTGNLGRKPNNIRPIVIETEKKELAKLAVQEKRSGVKYVKQVKKQGKTLDYLVAEVRRIWEEVPVEDD